MSCPHSEPQKAAQSHQHCPDQSDAYYHGDDDVDNGNERKIQHNRRLV